MECKNCRILCGFKGSNITPHPAPQLPSTSLTSGTRATILPEVATFEILTLCSEEGLTQLIAELETHVLRDTGVSVRALRRPQLNMPEAES